MRMANGFTLIEVLVAITVTAVIAASSFAILNQAMSTQSGTEQLDQRLSELQRALNRISLDFQQIAPRRVRNEYEEIMPALMGDKNLDETFVALTRQGKRNPANLPRSELERVIYRVENNKLIREQWAVLDIASDDQIIKREILSKVSRFEVEFLRGEEWFDSWPQQSGDNQFSEQANSQQVFEDFAEAVKLTLETDDYGEFSQIYLLPNQRNR
ncbi:MAG: type II secretion system minor pseudopilin GspJ [Kangiellaceae bacterium]|nr:type II secretion system minor pseudopilin GspJ [Kangiellaceae bacterium]